MDKIYYTTSYKYRVSRTFSVELFDCPWIPTAAWDENNRISMPFAYLKKVGNDVRLTLEKYYGWDGATWALDSKNFRRGSACHDALLELIGLGKLSANPWKLWTDNFLIKLCDQDGMWWPRRRWVYRAVRMLGDPKGSKKRKEYCAP